MTSTCSARPSTSPSAPWLPAARQPVDREAGIGAVTLYDQLKGFFRECAAAMQLADPAGAGRFAAASAHWLRHTHGSHAVVESKVDTIARVKMSTQFSCVVKKYLLNVFNRLPKSESKDVKLETRKAKLLPLFQGILWSRRACGQRTK